jgi:hypothetical protein
MSLQPLCFVLMPFGKKKDLEGATIDFDAVYSEIIRPAVEAAGLLAIRADEELTGGVIHKPMFERLILCEYAVADLTLANANVFYELGLRHAVRRHSTVNIFAEGSSLPFDVAPLRAMPYKLENSRPLQAEESKEQLLKRLQEARRAATEDPQAATDSPLYQLVEDYPNLSHTKTDVFRQQVNYSNEMKRRLAEARRSGVEAIRAVEQELGNLKDCEAGIVIDLMLSYRAKKSWDDMITLVGRMSRPLQQTVMVQEQLGFALNRAGRGEEAEQVLEALLAQHKESPETLGILGRVYKDRWEAALNAQDKVLADALLDKAIATYQRGFEADWRDAYPGVNAVTLMELKDDPDPKRQQLIPVVTYAVERRIANGKPDYWDYATLLELAVLANNEKRATEYLGKALIEVREEWEPESTARNLRLIREARERRQEAEPWLQPIEEKLERRAKSERNQQT